MKDIQLSKNFWLSELVKSSTADRLDIDNWPTDQYVIDNLKQVAINILQPVRDHFGVPIQPNSGFRCLELNRAVGSKDSSQHRHGQAVDFEVPGLSTYDLAMWIKENLIYDQLILEMYNPNEGINSGWVHCSYVSDDDNRFSTLTIFKRAAGGGVFNGLHVTHPE